MKIETKFNIGDKVYYIENERLIALEIKTINIFSSEKDSYHLEYKGEDSEGNLYWPLENELFEDKTQAFNDLIETLKIKFDIE